MMKRAPALILVLFAIFLSTEILAAETYYLSMLPRYGRETVAGMIGPLNNYLTKKTGLSLKTVFTTDFAEYENRLRNGEIDIGFENPVVYVKVSRTHEVLTMALKGKNGDKFRGVIIVRPDSGIKSISDLRHKKIMIASETAAGGYISQKITLHENGIEVEKDCEVIIAAENKHENVVISVYLGDVDAGFVRRSSLTIVEKYIRTGTIKILAECAWLPNWAFSVKRSIPEEKKKAIKKALLDLKKNDSILKALKINGFRAATDKEYDPVRQASGINLKEISKR